MKPLPILPIFLLALASSGRAQAPAADKAFYRENLLLEREKQEETERNKAQGIAPSLGDEKPRPRLLTLDFKGLDRPHDPSEFKTLWHNPPVRQWWTNTCWSYSTTSFLEAEIKRLSHREVKLSPLYTVYWEYIEKVKEFVRTKGESLVEEGSECGAVLLRWKQYGIVPQADYTGLVGEAKVPNHAPLIAEVRAYTDFLKKGAYWDEASAVAGLRAILDKHLGRPPETISLDGKRFTPKQYLAEVLKLNPDDYAEFMSTLSVPFWVQGEYKVPDNWWHATNYYNAPLEDWYAAIKGSVQKGFSVCIGGDVSEPGYEGLEDVALVPTFDLPAAAIDQSSREFRIYNHTTEDDHGIHIVGHLARAGHDWFLVKDSSRSGQRGVPGYYFYRDDYVRLKMLTFLVHKDAVKTLLAKFPSDGGKGHGSQSMP